MYSYPDKDEFIFLRHIRENKKTRTKEEKSIEYSIITKVPGRINASSGWNCDISAQDEVKKINTVNQVFSFHHNESENMDALLSLFLIKKGEKLHVDYYSRNDSKFIEEKLPGYHNESLSVSFRVKDKTYRSTINHIPNARCTMYVAEYPLAYNPDKLYNDFYPAEKLDVPAPVPAEV